MLLSAPFPHLTIRARIAWLVIACILPAWLLAVAVTYLSYERERARLQQHTQDMTRGLLRVVERDLSNNQAALQALATSDHIDRGDFAAFYVQAREVLGYSSGFTISLSDASGRQWVNLLRPYGDLLPKHGNPEFLRQVLESGKPQVSDLYRGAITGSLQVRIEVPVLRNGKSAYSLGMGISPGHLGEILQQQGLHGEWIISIFDSQGTIVARSHGADQFVGQKVAPALLEKLGTGAAEGMVETPTLDGIPVMATFSRSGAYGWGVVVGVPEKVLTADLKRWLGVYALGAAVLLLLGLVLAHYIGRRISRPIQALIPLALAIGKGEPVSVPALGLKEADEVGQALLQAQQLLRQRAQERDQAALGEQESEARYRSVVASLSEGVIVFNRDGRVMACNPAAEHILQLSEAQMQDRNVSLADWLPIRPDGSPFPVDELPVSRTLGKGESQHEVVAGHINPTGAVVWLSINSEPIFDGEGRIGAAVVSFSDITRRRQTEQELARYRETLEQRVNERTQELARANEALLRSNLDLQHFAHVAAHDLQTPLRSISGFAQLLRRDTEGRLDSQADEWITQVVENARRMQILIQDLLAYSRLESQIRPLEPTDFRQLLEEVKSNLAVAIAEAGAEVSWGEMPTVLADRTQMAQVLQNLMENGIKYNRTRPPRIFVSAERQGDEWVFSVSDNGIGIDPKYHQRIFEIFRRLHTYREYTGTGIGLAICKRVVERHGGRIWIESGQGAGSTFHFTLPAGTEAASQAAPAG